MQVDIGYNTKRFTPIWMTRVPHTPLNNAMLAKINQNMHISGISFFIDIVFLLWHSSMFALPSNASFSSFSKFVQFFFSVCEFIYTCGRTNSKQQANIRKMLVKCYWHYLTLNASFFDAMSSFIFAMLLILHLNVNQRTNEINI